MTGMKECERRSMDGVNRGESENPFFKNVQVVRNEIEAACAQGGRNPADVKLIGVTKTVTEDAILPLLNAGLNDFGENRWQQARAKLELPVAQSATWHFIGHLQLNKVKYIARHFDWIHSVDSVQLGEEISTCAARYGRTIRCLIQVNIAQEVQKYGLKANEVVDVIKEMQGLPHIELCGLMTMAPNTADVEETRLVFRELSLLQAHIRTHLSLPGFQELSMGMSNDYLTAIAEGSTMVRVGRRLMEIES